MGNHGFKMGILPDHCGKCQYLLWEEYECRCENTAFISDDDIVNAIEVTESEDPNVVVQNLLEYAADDSDWHGYDSICDLFVKIGDRERREIIRENIERLKERVMAVLVEE